MHMYPCTYSQRLVIMVTKMCFNVVVFGKNQCQEIKNQPKIVLTLRWYPAVERGVRN